MSEAGDNGTTSKVRGKYITGWCPGSQVKKEYPGEGNDQLYGGLRIDLWI